MIYYYTCLLIQHLIMIQIPQSTLIHGSEYYIESYGPNGLIDKYKGTYSELVDGYYLSRFTNVTKYVNGDEISESWFHTPIDRINPTTENDKSLYYWKYFIPADKVIKQKVKKYDTKVLLTKMLLIRQQYSLRIGDSSTIRGLIHGRYGLSKRK